MALGGRGGTSAGIGATGGAMGTGGRGGHGGGRATGGARGGIGGGGPRNLYRRRDRTNELQGRVSDLQAQLKDARTNGPNEVLGVDRGDDQFASKVRARLARRQYEDFKERFLPIQRDLAESATGDAGRAEALEEASESVDASFDAQQGAADRRLSRFGVSRTADQRRTDARERSLDRTATEVGARNQARRDVDARRMRLMTGGFGAKPNAGGF